MLFLKTDVTTKYRESFFHCLLLDLLFTASNLTFDLGLTFRPKSNLEGFLLSHQSITGLIIETICPEMLVFGKKASWMLLFSEYPDKSHNFTN